MTDPAEIIQMLRDACGGPEGIKMRDAADLIEVLQAEVSRLQKCRHECKVVCLLEVYEKKCAELERMKRERDAAVEDLRISACCQTCCNQCGLIEFMLRRSEGSCKDYEWSGPSGKRGAE